MSDNEDFRNRFYERYVSQFKQTNASDTPQDRAEFARVGDARYAPHFSHLNREAAILDLGCGHGRMLNYLRSRGYSNAQGIDISSEQIAIATADGLKAETADIFEYLTNHPASFDLIIAIDVVEHFTKPELLSLFDLISVALKPIGTILIQTANGEGLFPGHINDLQRKLNGAAPSRDWLHPASLCGMFTTAKWGERRSARRSMVDHHRNG